MSELEKKIDKINSRLSSTNSSTSTNSSISNTDDQYNQINDIYDSMSNMIQDIQLNIVLLTNNYISLKQEIDKINMKLDNNTEINNLKKSIIENRNILLQTLYSSIKQVKKEFKTYTIRDIDNLINTRR